MFRAIRCRAPTLFFAEPNDAQRCAPAAAQSAVRAAQRRTGCACCALTRMFINATRLVLHVASAVLKRIPRLPVDKTLTELPATFDARELKN